MFTVIFSVAGHSSFAQSEQHITPDDVYYMSGQIVSILKEMNTKPAATILKSYDTPSVEKLPRHVFQKTREVFLKIQDLRVLNGLTPMDLPVFSPNFIRPKEVAQLVGASLAGLAEIKDERSDLSDSDYVFYEKGKTPTDVHHKLHEALALLDSLLPQATKPSNVYRVAMIALSDMYFIYDHFGVVTPVTEQIPVGKKPKHVYEQVRQSLETLRRLCIVEPTLCVPGGVVVPPSRNELGELFDKTRPKHVLDIINTLVADISALKKNIGIMHQSHLPDLVPGKTPNDVFSVVRRIEVLLGELPDAVHKQTLDEATAQNEDS